MKYLFFFLILFYFDVNALTREDKETFAFCAKHNIKNCKSGDNNYNNYNNLYPCPSGQKMCINYDNQNRIKTIECIKHGENC